MKSINVVSPGTYCVPFHLMRHSLERLAPTQTVEIKWPSPHPVPGAPDDNGAP